MNYLQVNQNKCLQRIFFAHTKECPDPYYKLSEILKLENIHKLKLCCLIHKSVNKADSIPDIISDVLSPASSINRYNTRFTKEFSFFRMQISANSDKMSFEYAGPKIWESVPLEIRRLFTSFKKENVIPWLVKVELTTGLMLDKIT